MTQTQSDDGRTVREIMQSDDCVRSVQNPDGRLAAYRDGDEHVIVSYGNEPRTRWTERVPAERTSVDVDDRLWTIPDNWELIARETQAPVTSGIYDIDGNNKLVKLSIPTNTHLIDKWYGVKNIGTGLAADAEGSLGTAADVRALANEVENDEGTHSDDSEALRRVAESWETINSNLEAAETWVADEGIKQQRTAGQPLHLDDWIIECQVPQFVRPRKAINREVELSDLSTDNSVLLGVLFDLLRDANLVPSWNRFRISLED